MRCDCSFCLSLDIQQKTQIVPQSHYHTREETELLSWLYFGVDEQADMKGMP